MSAGPPRVMSNAVRSTLIDDFKAAERERREAAAAAAAAAPQKRSESWSTSHSTSESITHESSDSTQVRVFASRAQCKDEDCDDVDAAVPTEMHFLFGSQPSQVKQMQEVRLLREFEHRCRLTATEDLAPQESAPQSSVQASHSDKPPPHAVALSGAEARRLRDFEQQSRMAASETSAMPSSLQAYQSGVASYATELTLSEAAQDASFIVSPEAVSPEARRLRDFEQQSRMAASETSAMPSSLQAYQSGVASYATELTLSEAAQDASFIVSPEAVSPEALHANRKCIPCVAIVLTKDCRQGESCEFCHFSHEDNMNREQRPTKQMRLRCKQAISSCIDGGSADRQRLLDDLQNLLVDQAPFARNYTAKLLRDSQWLETGNSSGSRTATASSSSALPASSATAQSQFGKGGKQSKTSSPSEIVQGPASSRDYHQQEDQHQHQKGMSAGGKSMSTGGPSKGKFAGGRSMSASMEGSRARTGGTSGKGIPFVIQL
eukprot:TRINITY_DN6620_c0_g1_i1.p1 TRINITY_DN6620_c0_g1~~TRINITY_DN6620_c0_g1_i1.p1  ORF type:complete len:492 (-),score=90.41 TRINITY_DN6620_c0_g1_i1:30-1505(-)